MSYPVKNGQGSVVLRFKLLDSSSTVGAGLTGLTSASPGLIISTIADNEAAATAYTQAGSTIEGITTLGTFAAPTATKCRFKEVDATNHKGVYEFQFADARYAVASAKSLLISVAGAANLAQVDYVVALVSDDPYVAKPANSSLLSIDGNGRVDVIKVAGTPQTARDIGASVLLSAGTGTGQLDFTAGVVKSNLVQILATALTETAGQIAAAFKKFFDVAAPTGSVNSLPNAVAGAANGLLISGSNAGTTTFGALTITGATTFTGNVSMAAGFNITQSATNGSALVVTGNGTGSGAIFSSGSGAGGTGMTVQAVGTGAPGMYVNGTTGGISVICTGTGPGIFSSGGIVGGGVALSLFAISGSNAITAAGPVSITGAFTATHASNSINLGTDAITSGVVAASAVTKIQNGLATAVGVANVAAFVDTEVASILAAVTSTGAVLTAVERNAIADALLDRVDAIEAGLTLRQSHRLQAAAAAGKLSGAASTTVVVRNAVADSKPRITATVDADGNRSAVVVDVA